jgi:hypothetical protein
LDARYNVAVIVDTCAVTLPAALVFAGSLEELTRTGVISYLYSDDWERDAKTHQKEWGATFWKMWKIYQKGSHANPWLASVPPEVLEMDCWKAAPRNGRPFPGGKRV